MYYDVQSAIGKIDMNYRMHEGITGFFKEYCHDTTGNVASAISLHIIFIAFYFSNVYIIKLMNRMIEFIESSDLSSQ